MKIKREIYVLTPNAEYEFGLTEAELEKAHDEYVAIYGNDPLLDFIKQEVPFRLQEVIGIAPEKITTELVDSIVDALYDNSDIMFDYDKLDSWLIGQIEAEGNSHE